MTNTVGLTAAKKGEIDLRNYSNPLTALATVGDIAPHVQEVCTGVPVHPKLGEVLL